MGLHSSYGNEGGNSYEYDLKKINIASRLAAVQVQLAVSGWRLSLVTLDAISHW